MRNYLMFHEKAIPKHKSKDFETFWPNSRAEMDFPWRKAATEGAAQH
jgi:hypothetical protein